MDTVQVLLIEDDPEQASLYVQVLEAGGYRVVTTETAEEAQARLTEESFALLLADWDLGPGRMQGDALIRWAKSHDPRMKTILFSNHLEVADVADACGADASFRKVEGIIPLRRLVAQFAPLGTDHA